MIKSILGGKSKNLCDVSHLITLPVDKSFEGYGFWEVEINVEPDTVYTFSRENANQINVGGATYLGIINRYDAPNGGNSHWLNHETLPGLCHQNVQITAGAEGKLWIFFSANVYKKWQNHENPFGYIQLEKGSTATEYVPHELTSYKSIMKVSDGHFVTSFDERMPCKTKNLFSSSTEVGTLEGGYGGPTVARNFEENKWYQGFATNGCYGPWNVPDFDIHPNSLYVYSNGAGYGMSRAIKCEPNTKYFISCSYSHISGGEGNVYVGYYDEGGNFISNLNMDIVYKISITTPSNCKWLIINFTTQGVGKVYFSDIQLVKGTTATDYVPYGYV